MATRMQQRRGTAAQWISTNSGNGPVLNAGEIGFEVDTNKFKIGDGVNHWVDLDYFTTDSAEAVTAEVEAAINNLIGGAPGTLDTLNELAAALNDDPAFFTTIGTDLSDHTSATTNVHGIVDTDELATKEYVTTEIGNSTVDQSELAGDGIEWNAGTEQFDVDSTIARVNSPTFTGTVSGITKDMVGLGDVDNSSDADKPISTAAQAALDLKAPLANPTFTGTVSGVTKAHVGLGLVDNTSDANKQISTAAQAALDLKAPINSPTFTGTVSGVTKAMVGLGNAQNTSDADKPVSTATQTELDLKADIESPTFTGSVIIPDLTVSNDLVVEGDFTVNGTNFNASATSITIEDNLVQLAHNQAGNTVDLGLVVAYNDGTYRHAGIVRDVSESKWKLFKNVVTEPATTVDFASGALDNLQVAEFEATSATIGDVSNTELQYLNGVTAPIQDQINAKINATAAASTYAPLSAPTFTGTVSGITKAMVGLGNVDNTSDLNKPTSTAVQAELALKLDIADAEDTYAPIDSPTFTGTVSGVTKAMVGLSNVDNTSDADKAISTATQNALDLKAPSLSPTFTGTVSGITKGMVGLSQVDNTSDLSKPISTLTQTALDAKLASSTAASTYAPIASPTFTGTVAGITKSMVGLSNVDNTADINKPISSATQQELNLKLDIADAEDTYAPLDSPTFTGTVSGVTKAMVGLGNVDNTTDAGKPVSTATQTALDLKAPLANPTFTGTVAGITKSMVGLGSVDNTSDANKPISTATSNALDLKAPLASPTFTGTVTLPTGTVTSGMILDGTIVAGDIADGAITSAKIFDGTIVNGDINASAAIDWTKLAISSTVSATELGYVDGVTSSIQTQLGAKAPLASPALTGVPTAPTAAANTNTTQIATTAYVQTEIADLIASAPGALDTLDELAAALGDDANYAATITTALGGKAPLASPALTGTPTSPTAAADTNTTQVATTAYVVGQASAATPAMNGTAAVGTSLKYARADHVHASDTTRAPLASPTFTGTVTIPNGAALGTPASATLTNATGLPVATGIANLGTGVATFLATPSSANFASMITDEIGTGNIVLSEAPTNAQTASYTLVAADRSKMVEMNVASANTLTVPLNSSVAFPVGTKIDILQVGAGQTTIAGAGGVTVNATPGLKLRAQWGSATLIKRATDTWVLVGDLSA